MGAVRPLFAAAAPTLACALAVTTADALAQQPPTSPTHAGRVAPCDPAGRDLCDLERPEDLTALRGTPWVLVSTLGGPTPLVLIDTRARARFALVPRVATGPAKAEGSGAAETASDSACTTPPGSYRSAGHDVRRAGAGWVVALVNHGHVPQGTSSAHDRIELFALRFDAADEPRLEWTGCIAVPDAHWMLNDVALGPRGEIYATLMYERESGPDAPARLRQRWIAGEPTGRALRWQRGQGWSALEGTALVAANGIMLSADDRTLAIAGTYSRALLLVDVARRSAQATATRIDLPLQPDNLTALPDGGFLVAGHTGVPVSGVDPCRDPQSVPCGFPFAVARVAVAAKRAPLRARTPSEPLDIVYRHDGHRIPGASVALALGRALWLGSAFGDRITILDEVLP